MASKPVGIPALFAPDANYPAGPDPWAGSATKIEIAGAGTVGIVPEQPVNAQELNKAINDGTAWDQWTASGTELATLDAHLVETSADGQVSVASAQVGGTAGTEIALTVVENSAAPSPTAVFQNTAGNECLQVEVVGGAGDGVASATVDGHGFSALVSGSGSAFSGASVSGLGVVATAGSTAGKFTTTGTSVAALSGRVPLGSTLSGIAVHGIAEGLGTAVKGTAVGGYGVVAESDPTNPARSSLRMVPQTGDGSDPLTGDHMYNTQHGPSGGPRCYRGGGAWHSVHTSPNGFVQGVATVGGGTLAGSSTSAELVEVSLQGLDTIAGGTLMASVSFDVGATAGAFTLRIFDVTGAPVQKAVRAYPASAMSPHRTIFYRTTFSVADNTARQYAITLETDSATALDYGAIVHHIQGTF